MGNMAAALLVTAGLVLAQGGGVVQQEDLAPPGEMAPEREEPERDEPAPDVEAEPVEEEEEAPEPSEPAVEEADEPERHEPETRPQPRSQAQQSVPAFWFVLPN